MEVENTEQNGSGQTGSQAVQPEATPPQETPKVVAKKPKVKRKVKRKTKETAEGKKRDRIVLKKKANSKVKKLKEKAAAKKKKKDVLKDEKLRQKYVSTTNSLINFFSALAEVPIAPIKLMPTPVKQEPVYTEEELMVMTFGEKYPKYVSHANKIMYPVEDELFDEFPFLVTKTTVPNPRPQMPGNTWIEPQQLKYIMKICTFFSRFDELLQGPSFDKYELAAAINYQVDNKYVDLIHDVHIALLYVFIDEFEEGSRFDYAKEYGLIFFLIKHLKDDFLELHFRVFWPEVLHSLSAFPDYGEMLSAENIGIFEEIARVGVTGYNFIDPLLKLKAINALIEMLHELTLFRNNLGGLFEKQNELSKEKLKVQTEIKDVEAELTVERSNLKNEEDNLKLQEEILRNLPRLEMPKKRQEIDDIKRKVYKMQSNINKHESQSAKLKSSFDELKVKAPYLIHPTQLVGKDKERNLYFFFSDDPSGIYVQLRSEDKQTPSTWAVYRTEEGVENFLNRLNKNGKREGALYTSIKNLLKDQHVELVPAKKSKQIVNEIKENGQPDQEAQKANSELLTQDTTSVEEALEQVFEYESIYQPQEDYIKNSKMRNNKNMYLLEIFRERINKTDIIKRATFEFMVEMLLDLETEFTNYLRGRKCRWTDKQSREAIRKDIVENLNEQKVADLLIQLNHKFIHIETFLKRDENGQPANDERDNSENDEQEDYVPKKRKNKLWKGNEGDDEEKQNAENVFDEDFENDPKYYAKRKVLKTWGFYNERFKQAWETFVSNSTSASSSSAGSDNSRHIGALYLGTSIFVEIICRYITRKLMKTEEEQPHDRERERGKRMKEERVNRDDRDDRDGDGASSADYHFRKRKVGRQNLEGNAIEKFNLRVKNRIERDKKREQKPKDDDLDPYDDIDDYSPDRLKTTRNTRALTRKLNKQW